MRDRPGGVGVVQPGEKEGDLREAFQDLKGDYEKDGDKRFSKACSDRTGGRVVN